ncbi:MAG: TonB-dependent receptor [Acidobacteria bacterium]|nr:TonB-dependent receptor [Acidobacteriota bacterium]
MRKFQIQSGVFCALIICLFALGGVFGQEFRATITGTVSDPNGAVIPGATVTVKNIETNVATTARTNDDGSFTVPFLLPGKYSVSAAGSGFKTSIRENITLNVDDKLTVDFQLEIGTEAEVNVVAETEVLERGSVTTGTVVTQRQIEELPLSEGAAYSLATQAPGVIYTGNPQFTGPTSNGNLASLRTNGVTGNQITLDGSPNLAFDGAVAYTPPSDAVSQFKIQTNTFDAQNGFTAGSTVNVAVKNGTNKLHGSLSYFERRKQLTSNNFFSNRSGVARPDRLYYRFGGQVNGPVRLPFYDGRDRTFFMFSAEKQYTKVPQPILMSVPTAKMRTGDFSELLPLGIIIYDPATAFRATANTCVANSTSTAVCRLPFANNIIPTARLNAAALRYLALYPQPNLPGFTNNYFSNQTNILPYKTYLTRIDHNIDANQRIFGKFFWSKSTDDKYNFLESPDAFTRGFENRTNKGGSVNYTATLSSDTVLDIRGNYNDFVQQRLPVNPISATDLGFTGISAISTSKMLPRFNFTNFDTFGPQRSDYNEGLVRDFSELSLQPSITKIWGGHTIKVGYDFRRLMENRQTNGNNAGNFTTTGTYTTQASSGTLIGTSITNASAVGRDIASFLLGIPTSGTIEQAATYNVYSNYHGFFFQDDWRVTQKLTLNLGVRYETESGLLERNGQIVTGFNAAVASPLRAAAVANYNASIPTGVPSTAFDNLSGGLVFADSASAANQSTDKNNIQPRIGVSYALNDKTVLRGGFGIFTAPFQIQAVNQTGFTATTTYTASSNNGLTFLADINNPFPTGLNPAFGSTQGYVTSVGSTLGTVGSTGPTAAILSYQRKNSNYLRGVVGIQRQLPFDFGVEASLVYSHGYDLPVQRQLNYVPAQYLNNLAGVTDPTTITTAISNVSTFLTTTVPNPFRGLVPTNSTWNAATLARWRLLTNYPQFADLVTTEYNGSSDFASIQLQAVKRFTKGLSLNASYTFSYDHEKVRRLNPQDAELSDMISAGSRPHRVTFSGIYELPFGKNRWIGKGWNNWVEAFLGGWQLQAVYEWQSGEPLILPNVFYSGDPKQLKNLLGKSDGQGRKYGVDIPAFDTSGFFLSNGTVPSFGNNYATSSQNTLRYLPYTLNNFRNQPFQKFDAGLTKNFTIREGMKLQIRIEGINAFNWVYFTGLNLTPSASATSSFGYANSQRNLPRDIQLGARFTF